MGGAGETRRKFARRLMITFLLWCVKHDAEVAVCYHRTNHNVAADEIARVEETELETRGAKKRLNRVNLPD